MYKKDFKTVDIELTGTPKLGLYNLRIGVYQTVMLSSEYHMMEVQAKIVGQHGGHILEAGFGLGCSAKHIDSYANVKEHTIVELNDNVYKNLLEYKNKSNVKINTINEDFECWIKNEKDNSYDGVFFDTFPILDDDEYLDKNNISNIQKVFKDIYRVLKPGGVYTFYDDDSKSRHQHNIKLLLDVGFKPGNMTFENYKQNNHSNGVFYLPKIYK